ncbi:hypothetical protein S7711_11216 [Stachybotrys chartarum IBT 7711]|uniref:Uncharacterized protein n=1 Tax=Stachybotrys chartarum (strain CBS 109288 / IBT 7711) TaxID=1280523 RepID=A0A084B247_STACB|nr:hypothetical protein S7711_11216 [Stachybotrys chartarum IBT 7711]
MGLLLRLAICGVKKKKKNKTMWVHKRQIKGVLDAKRRASWRSNCLVIGQVADRYIKHENGSCESAEFGWAKQWSGHVSSEHPDSGPRVLPALNVAAIVTHNLVRGSQAQPMGRNRVRLRVKGRGVHA